MSAAAEAVWGVSKGSRSAARGGRCCVIIAPYEYPHSKRTGAPPAGSVGVDVVVLEVELNGFR